MKHIRRFSCFGLICIVLLCSLKVEAQTVFTKDSLSISAVIPYQQKMNCDNYEVKFKKVISDSRCPKQVTCVRAGEAKVLLSLYKNGEFISDKEISIHASGYVMEETNLAFGVEDFNIYGMTLKPYPMVDNNIPDSEYELEIVFQPKQL